MFIDVATPIRGRGLLICEKRCGRLPLLGVGAFDFPRFELLTGIGLVSLPCCDGVELLQVLSLSAVKA